MSGMAAIADSIANGDGGSTNDYLDALADIAGGIGGSALGALFAAGLVGGGAPLGFAALLGSILGGYAGSDAAGFAMDGLQELFDDILDSFKNPPPSPLVLDLDGDGIELMALQGSSVHFDLGMDGFAELTGWVAPDDALLALDLDENGRIDDGSELFGDQTGFANGFLALAAHDSNGDGVIDAQDSAFANLLLWQDANGDGVSQADELISLADAGIESISVAATSVSYQVAGNDVLWQAGFSRSGGAAGIVVDAFFKIDPVRTVAVLPDGFEYNPDALILPLLQGAGQLASTSVALSMDADLRAQAMALVAQASSGDITGFLSAFEQFVMDWAGAGDVDTNSRGPAINGRKVAFIEAVFGQAYVQDDAYFANPGPIAALALDWKVSNLIEAMAAQFLSQVPISSALLAAVATQSSTVSTAGHVLQSLPSVWGGTVSNFDWVGDFLAEALGSGDLDLADVEALFSVMRHFVGNLDAYGQAISDGYVAAGGTAADGQELADRVVQEHGHYVTDTSGNDTIQGGAGDDVLVGRAGSDTYVWGVRYGQ